MLNKSQPLQRHFHPHQNNNGLWYFSVTKGTYTENFGSCAQMFECESCRETANPECDFCSGAKFVKNENPCSGHNTSAMAVAHFKEYLADRAVEKNVDVRAQCALCPRLTYTVMASGSQTVWLCQFHLNREGFLAGIETMPHHFYLND